MAAERTVVVRLIAMVGQYRAAIAESAAVTRALDTQMLATNRLAAGATRGLIASQRGAMGSMAGTLRSMRGMMLGLGVPLALGAMAKSFFDFEQKMAHVKAVADSFGKSTTGMQALSNAALEMGQRFGFSATEVASAEESLLKAGRSTAQVLGGELSAALTLAAAGTISLDDAARISSVTMTIFQDEFRRTGESAQQVADTMVGAANVTVSGVQEMGNALSYVGPLAASLGVTFEETAATISVFNQAGIEGERAGTNLRGMLTNLLSPSAMAQQTMVRLGIDLHDNQGHFVGMAKAAQILHDRFLALAPGTKDLTSLTRAQADAVGKLTTNASMPGFIVLMRGGAKVVTDMEKAIRAAASAEDVAATKLDSVTGSFQKFGAALQTATIRLGAGFSGQLTWLGDRLTSTAKGFDQLGTAGQTSILALAGWLIFARRFNTSMAGMSQGIGTTARNFVALRTVQRGGLAPGLIGPLLPMAPGADRELRNAMTSANNLTRTLGSVRGAWVSTTGVVNKFGAAGVQAMRGIQRAGQSVLGFLGGWTGAAFTGGLILMTAVMSQMEAQKRRAEELRSGLAVLGMEYARTGRMSTDRVNDMLRENTAVRDLINNSKAYGLSVETVAKAVNGEAAAYDQVIAKYDATIHRAQAYSNQLALMRHQGATDLGAEGAGRLAELGLHPHGPNWFQQYLGGQSQISYAQKDLLKFLETSRTARAQFVKLHKDEIDLANAAKAIHDADLATTFAEYGLSATDASNATSGMMENLLLLSSKEAPFEDRIKAMTSNVQALADSFYAVASAQAAFYDAARGLKDAFSEDVAASTTGRTSADTSTTTTVIPGKGKAKAARTPSAATTTTTTTPATGKAGGATTERTGTRTRTVRNKDGSTTTTTTETAADGTVTTTVTHEKADKGDIPAHKRAVPLQLDEVTGQIDVTTAAGSKQNAAVVAMAEASAKTVMQVYNEVALRGGKTAESFQFAGTAAAAAFMKQRKAAEDALTAVLHNRDAAKQLVDAYFAMPADLALNVGAQGADELLATLKGIGVEMVTLSQGRVVVTADSKDAADKLHKLGGTIKRLPSGKFRVTFANQQQMATALSKLAASRIATIKVRTEKEEAERQLKSAARVRTAQLKAWADHKALQLSGAALDKLAKPRIAPIIAMGFGVGGKMDATAPKPGLDYFGNPLRKGQAPTTPKLALGPLDVFNLYDPARNRWGGLYEARNGLLSGAQLGSGGPLYQWAEPATGGEAFIPRRGQRGRSMAILDKAASWYGASVQSGPAWKGANLSKAAPNQVQITVRGEGVLSGMIEATVDGRLVKVAQAVSNGRGR